MSELAALEHVRTIALPSHANDTGDLTVLEGGAAVPFDIARVFLVRAEAGARRGNHAHKECSQIFVCCAGRIEVACDDGSAVRSFTLASPATALLVPPGIWAAQTYEAPGSVLAVLCDRPYEEADYLRDYDAFLAFRRAHAL